MKQRLINVLKWILITFGVLFVLQALVVVGIILGIKGFNNADYTITKNTNKNLKQMQPIINFAENYRLKNGKYPKSIEGVKIKPDLYFKYETTNNDDCYSITTKNKKDNLTRQYQHCATNNANSNSSTESYVEFTN